MSIKISPLALAAIGLVRKLSGAQSGSEIGEDSSGMDFDTLVESGEEAFDEFLSGITKARIDFGENAKQFASDLLADLGVATHKEIEELRKSIEKDKVSGDAGENPAE